MAEGVPAAAPNDDSFKEGLSLLKTFYGIAIVLGIREMSGSVYDFWYFRGQLDWG